MNFKSTFGLISIASLIVACSDASTDFPEGNSAAGAAGAAGSAGGSTVIPPGTGGSVSPATGGSAGSAGSSVVVPPDAGAAGSTADAGTICVGQSCEFGKSAACVQNGAIYLCSCYGIYLPQGVNVTCGDAGTAGSGGSDAGSVVIPPEAGVGGSSNTGGSAGSSSTGGSGGSSATGGSAGSSATGGSGGTVGTGGTGGTSTGPGTMVVTIVAPITGQHAYTVYAQTLTFMPGEPDWNSPKTVSGTRATVFYTAYAGSTFKLGGYYDPEAGQDPWKHQFCNPSSLKMAATVFATFNGKAMAAPIVKSNGQNGCDLWLTATPLNAQTDDADGDGFLAHASDPAIKDCDDSKAEVHPGQIETPDDNVDFDCDGNVNPPRVGYQLFIGQQTYVPVLYDWGHGGTQYTMTYVEKVIQGQKITYYETFVAKPIAATDFVVQYGSSNWNVGWNYNQPGSCIVFANVQVYLEGSNTTYPTTSVAIPQYTTCHTAVSGL